MTIIAIWERKVANKRYGSIFCLTDDGQFLTLSHNTKYDGTNKDGSTRYVETGDPDWGNAFDDKRDWDIFKANYTIIHFGGHLIWWDNQYNKLVKQSKVV